jgi:hypothetical protein
MSILYSININDIYIQLTILILKTKYYEDPSKQFVTRIKDKCLSLNMLPKEWSISELWIFMLRQYEFKNILNSIYLALELIKLNLLKIHNSLSSNIENTWFEINYSQFNWYLILTRFDKILKFMHQKYNINNSQNILVYTRYLRQEYKTESKDSSQY